VATGEQVRAKVAELRQRVRDERLRAAKAAAIAANYERLVDEAPTALRPLRVRMAVLHRRLELRHAESARLQELYADRLHAWGKRVVADLVRPTFIDAVAAAVGCDSTAMTLLGRSGDEALAAASDVTARMAHDAEFMTAEGPAHDVAAVGATVRVGGDELGERWPRFGPIVAELGVRAVVGVPLRQEPGGDVGALCVYTPEVEVTPDLALSAAHIADALTHTVLNHPGAVADDEIPVGSILDEAAFYDTVNQAAGVVSVRNLCDLDSALAILRARAFADGIPVESLARGVIRGDVEV
jgi:hypothetical protein